MDALFEILFINCRDWMKTRKLKFPKSFTDTSSLITNVNNTIQDFVDKTLVKTKSDKDRIGKDDMLSLYKLMYPHSHITLSQLLMGLKEKNIENSKSHRCKRIQGCYLFVIKRDDFDEDEDEDDEEKEVEQIEEEEEEEYKLIKQVKIKMPLSRNDEEVKIIKTMKIIMPTDNSNIINKLIIINEY